MKRRIKIAITIGDPSGVGPEVSAKALKGFIRRRDLYFFVIGDSWVLARYGLRRLPNMSLIDLKNVDRRHFRPGTPNRNSAQASLEYLATAVSLMKRNLAHSLVTAPLSKEAVRGAGFSWPGHTEYLAGAFSSHNAEMVFVSKSLKVVLVTRHLALREAASRITKQRILRCGRVICGLLKKRFSIRHPRIAVCGLNPHAGEGGLFGAEERRVIPAIKKLNKEEGAYFSGPFAADKIFRRAYQGEFDMVMAMYHDQGLIPFKLLDFQTGVNLTAGLPFIRTSPVHGTAFDIAGRGMADCQSMGHAVLLAAKLGMSHPR